MNFKKIVAAVAAAAVAVSMMSVTVFAGNVTSNSGIDASSDGVADGVIKLFESNSDTPIDILTPAGVNRADVYGLRVTLDVTADAVNGSAWIGGGMGANSETAGWLSVEWGQASGGKQVTLGEDGVLTWISDKVLFADSDTYCQLWIQAWGEDITIKTMEALDKDGNVIAAISDSAAPADTEETVPEATDEVTEDDAAPVEEDTTEEVVDDTAEATEEVVDDAAEATEEVVDDTAETTETAPEADATTDAAATGNVAVASIVSVMTLAGAAAIVAKKRK